MFDRKRDWAVILFLLFPSIYWIVADQSVWMWDQSWYGEVSVRLYHALISKTMLWPKELVTSMAFKAPGLPWFAQFFVPIGDLIGSIEIALLFAILSLNALALYLMGWIFRQKSGVTHLGWFSTMGFLASAPLFIGLTHQMFVEPLQLVVVAGFCALLLKSKELHPLESMSILVFLSFAGVIAKISTPMYVLAPGGLILWQIVRSFRENRSVYSFTKLRILGFAGVIGFSALVLAWYVTNWGAILEFMRTSSSGAVAAHYGSNLPFFSKVGFWLSSFESAYFSIAMWAGLGIAFVVSLVKSGLKFFDYKLDLMPSGPWSLELKKLLLVSIFQIILVLLVFSTQINEETRYLLPLLPYIGLVVFSFLGRSQGVVGGLVAVSILIHFAWMNSLALGFLDRDWSRSHWLIPMQSNAEDRNLLKHAVRVTCTAEASGRYNFFSVDEPEFNANTASFFASADPETRDIECRYRSLGYAETDPINAFSSMRKRDPLHFITRNPDELSQIKDQFNLVAAEVDKVVRRSPSFVFMAEESLPRLHIFKRVTYQ